MACTDSLSTATSVVLLSHKHCSQYGTKGPLLCGKQATTEGGMRVPALVNWPGRVPGGRVTHGMGAVMDIFSTVLDLAGVQPPSDRPYDGVSLWPLLSG